MKVVFFLFFTFFYTTTASGYCGDYGFDVFPENKNIAQNSIFILNGSAFSADVILNLNKKNNIYLKYGDKKIRLLIEKINVGEFNVTQAILKPETALEIGLTYTMCIDSVKLERFNQKTTEYEPVTYTITKVADTQKPIVRQKLHFLKKGFTSLGCGNVLYLIFKAKIKDESAIFIKTTVKNLTTETETVFYLPFEDKKIYIGNGMCYGPFKFWCTKQTDKLEVVFSVIDAAGNVANWQSKPYSFTVPTEKDGEVW